jgi:hypothetical protein
MAEPLRSVVGQFSSSGGRWQPRALNARSVEPASDHPRADRGSFYVLIEVTGAGGSHAALYRQLLNAAQTAYYEVGEAVEVALRQAVREVQAILRRANEALPEANWRAGMTMVVRYGQHLVIAQAGPALLLISHPKTVDIYPEKFGDSGPPLGGPERPEVVIYDAVIEHGSMVLVAQSDWAQHVKMEALAVAAAATSVNAAAQYLGQLAGRADLSALLISFTHDIPTVKEDADGLRTLSAGGPTGIAPVEPEAPPAEQPKPGKGLFAGLFAKAKAQERVESEEAAPLDAAEEVRSLEEDAVLPPVASRPPGPRVSPPPPVEPQISDHVEPAPSLAEQHAAAEAEARQQAAWGQRVTAEPAATPAHEPVIEPEPFVPAPPPRSGRSGWALVLAVVFIPLLILGVVVGMLFVRTRAADAQFAETLAGAGNIISQAEQAADDAAAAQRLSGAKEFLDQARALRPDDPTLKEMIDRYEKLVMRVEKVTPLYGIVPLWPFQPETGHDLARAVVSGESIFVLDKAPDQVYRFTRSALGDSVKPASDKPVVAKGDPAGDKTVGDLLDMTWVEAATANQRSMLHVMDVTGELIGYDEVYGQKRMVLTKTGWVSPQLVAGYMGNLYVADPGANQVWKYAPTANGYEGEPTAWFPADKKPDMTDGHIWLLHSDGRLLKFLSGEQRPFNWSDLPTPLNGPTALALSQDGDRLYVADPGNARIIEATKDGKFLRQFRAREGDLLRDVKDLVLDEAKGTFYILTSNQLYKASVPQPGATQ